MNVKRNKRKTPQQREIKTMKRNAKIDKNQPEIVSALRRVGAVVLLTHQLKNAFDILVGFQGQLYIMEIKNPEILPKKFWNFDLDERNEYLENRLTDGEKLCLNLFQSVCVGYHIVYDVQSALDVLGINEVYEDDFFKT